MLATKHSFSQARAAFISVLLVSVSAALPLGARTVKFATYSAPYVSADKKRDMTFNKYRRLLIAAIAEEEGWSAVFVDGAAEGDISALKAGAIDVLCSARHTVRYAADGGYSPTTDAFSFGYMSEKPLFVEHDVVVSREGDKRFINGDLFGLNGAKLGYYGEAGLQLATRFRGLCRAANAAIEAEDCHDAERMEARLREGQIDLCVMGLHDVPNGFKVVYNMGTVPIYFLCKDEEVKAEIDHAVSEFEKSNPFFMAELAKRVGGGSSLNVSNFNPAEVAFVKRSQRENNIVVTVHSNSMPFSDIDAAGNFIGLDSALWQKISLISGLQFFYADADKCEREDDTNYLRIANANSYRTHSDYKRYTPAIITHHERIYSRPGYNVESFLRSAPDDAANRFAGPAILAIIREQRVILPFIDRWCKEYSVMICDDQRECLEKTSDGIADICIINESFLRSMHNIEEYPRLASRKPLLLDVPVSIEVKGPHSALITSILNKSLCQIPLEYFEQENIAAETEMGYVPSRHTSFSRNAIGIVMFIFLLGASLLVCTVILSHRYKVRSETDDVTGFPNLAKFIRQGEHIIETTKADKEKTSFTLTSISVLGFRHLNNTFGYEWGNRLLSIISDCLRHIDTTYPMLITHCYDDIFYCFSCLQDRQTSDAKDISDRMTSVISNHVSVINETLVKAGFHVVIKSSAVYSSGLEGIRSMLDKADYARESVSSESAIRPTTALSAALKHGNFALFDGRLSAEREQENNIEQHIVQAFDRNEITAVFQPKIDLRTGRLEGAEAFARWHSPKLGMVMPNVFLPVFEKNGYALRFNFTIYTKVLSFLQSLIDRGDTPLPISMNVTHIGVNADAFARRFENVFSRFSVPRNLIEFELSEVSLGMSRQELRRLSTLLNEGGFSVAIDDFGTGGSSLSMLGSVSADIIKFDQRLLSDSNVSNRSRIILTKTVEMAHQLGRKVVCKCVEKKTQVEFLRSLGCDMVQGFYYSAALPPEEFRDYMDSSI